MRRTVSLSFALSLLLGVSTTAAQESKPREATSPGRVQVDAEKKSEPSFPNKDSGNARIAGRDTHDRTVVHAERGKGAPAPRKGDGDDRAQIKPRTAARMILETAEAKQQPPSRDKGDVVRAASPQSAEGDDRARIKPLTAPKETVTVRTKEEPEKRVDKTEAVRPARAEANDNAEKKQNSTVKKEAAR